MADESQVLLGYAEIQAGGSKTLWVRGIHAEI